MLDATLRYASNNVEKTVRKSILSNILTKCRADLPGHPQYQHFPHWTFLVKDNKIISSGVNRCVEPSRYYGYHANNSSLTFRPKWHAELDAIHRCNFNLRGCEVVNVRLNRSGEIRISFPCKICRTMIRVLNCKKVYYTTDTPGSLFESYSVEI